MVPAGVVDATLHTLTPLLEKGDIIIDGGNSYYIDDIRRAQELKAKGIHYVDVGTSGGVWGLERGYCLMIGGEDAVVQHLDPIFATLAPGHGRHPPHARAREGGRHGRSRATCTAGPAGPGHFVKMVHNGIEYGLMAAYAEGLNILKHANAGKHSAARSTPRPRRCATPNTISTTSTCAEIAEVWRRGSVIASWLLDLTAAALREEPRPGEVRRPRVGLRRRPLDPASGHRRIGPGAGPERGAVRALQLARRGRFRRSLLSAMRSSSAGTTRNPPTAREHTDATSTR